MLIKLIKFFVCVTPILFSPLILNAQKTDDLSVSFSNAQDSENNRDYETALNLYKNIANQYPNTSYSKESIFKIAVIYDEKLYTPPLAVNFYKKYLDQGSGRNSERARTRINYLQKYENINLDKYQEYITILNSNPGTNNIELRKKMEAFIDENPNLPMLDDALLWLANEVKGYRRMIEKKEELKDIDNAIKLYLRIVNDFPNSQNRIIALKNLGDCYLFKKDYQTSKKYYEMVNKEGGQFGQLLVDEYAYKAETYLLQDIIFYFFLIVIPIILISFHFLFPFNIAAKHDFQRALYKTLFLLPFATFICLIIFILGYQKKDNIVGNEPYFMLSVMSFAIISTFFNNIILEIDKKKEINIFIYIPLFTLFIVGVIYCLFYIFGTLSYIERLLS
ncbi:MAG: tetratricopeptide repeat protein [Desulfobacterales bacterium]|nr:tetratricopeptide repeat protein [Desulfobacterales bacterium]